MGAESPHLLRVGRHSRQRPQGSQAVSRLSEVVSRRLGGTSRETQTELACLRIVFLLPGHILSDRGEDIHSVRDSVSPMSPMSPKTTEGHLKTSPLWASVDLGQYHGLPQEVINTANTLKIAQANTIRTLLERG